MKRVFQHRESDDKGDPSERDREPIGLELWYEGQNAQVDIIFIHGLMGNRNKTWQATGSSGSKLDPWPKALLPAKLPKSRIFTFGYDAKVTDTKEFMGKVSAKTLRDHAAELIYSICHQRRASVSSDRSLIFVCHSLGGLVCKEGLLFANQRSDYRQIFQSTRGIIFMGTPHHGSEAASYAQHLTNWMSSMKQVNTKLLEALKKDSEMLENIHDDFCSLIREKRQSSMESAPGIVCFFEELPMRALGYVVSKKSATIPGFACRGIHANHKGMTKFSSENDAGFQSFLEELWGFLPPSARLTVTDLAVCAPKQALNSIGKESDKGKGSCDEEQGFIQPRPSKLTTTALITPVSSIVPFDTELSSLSDVLKVTRPTTGPTTELEDVVDVRYPEFHRNFVSTRRACDGCLCFRTVSRESSMVNLFFLRSSGEKVEIAEHQPSCRFHNQMRTLERSQTVEFRGSWIPLRIAVYLMTTNYNINASINYVKVLGEDAPAWRLYDISLLALCRTDWDAQYGPKFVTELVRHILRLHREGHASISDVYLYGLTSLDMIMIVFFVSLILVRYRCIYDLTDVAI
uniref:GPI inositol-deacylase n=1 Tax=Bionectria ochroleuca TaxID=29856 RepID=A0A8H7NIQ7_BIOOC